MRYLLSRFVIVTTMLAGLAISSLSQACDHCADESPCRKVCRLVYEPKKIEITCWGCKCEEFCVPGHAKVKCRHCDTVCEFCETEPNSDVSSAPKKFVWREWIPGSAKIFTRKKLMKRTVTKTIPSYKWVVEDLCEKCEMNLPEVKVEPGASVPPPPVPVSK